MVYWYQARDHILISERDKSRREEVARLTASALLDNLHSI